MQVKQKNEKFPFTSKCENIYSFIDHAAHPSWAHWFRFDLKFQKDFGEKIMLLTDDIENYNEKQFLW